MARSLLYTEHPWATAYSEIIDVRSPQEFTEDHLPGALNLPVLSDAERGEVGTLYKQVDPFTARKLGAARVAENIARHLTHHFAAKDHSYQPLIYCWRGGQRSLSLALVLAEIGWRVTLLQGGYKTYRAWVRQQLLDLPQQFTYRILCGATGSGKTHLLHGLAEQGAQVLDLEALAAHRGSLLGQEWQMPQPSQKYFETLLLQQLQRFDPHQPIWLESESAKIGQLYIPPALWQAMMRAECVEVQTPMPQRVQWLLHHYPHWITHPEVLKQKLAFLKHRYGSEMLQAWVTRIDRQEWPELVQDLLESHYDPTYQHALQRSFDRMTDVVHLADFSQDSIARVLADLLHSSLPSPSPPGS
jgi:tRNA 2-selenouridine synthase